MINGRVAGPNSVFLRDDVVIVYGERRDRSTYKNSYKVRVKKYVRVKRLQPLTKDRWEVLQALDVFFGYTEGGKFLL